LILDTFFVSWYVSWYLYHWYSPTLLLTTVVKSAHHCDLVSGISFFRNGVTMILSIGGTINDIRWPWTAIMHFIARNS